MKVEAKAEAGEGVPQEGQPQRWYGVKQGTPCKDVAVGSGCQRAEATGRTGWGKECAVVGWEPGRAEMSTESEEPVVSHGGRGGQAQGSGERTLLPARWCPAFWSNIHT